jgi:hypothetical protein
MPVDTEARPSIPAALLERLRRDPLRVPEELALAAGDTHGPAAARWAATAAAEFGSDPALLTRIAKRRHGQWARFGGAVTGMGGVVTILPDLAGVAWIQSRLVFCVAAAHGFDPTDPMRPAELLTIQGVYPDVGQARAALDGTGRTIVEQLVLNRVSREQAMLRGLVLMAGKSSGKKLAGKMIPGFAMLFNAVANERDTRRVGERARRFYGG